NTAPFGAGIYAIGESRGFNLRLINNTIADNNATVKGGGLYLYNGYADMTNNIIWNNTAPNDSDVCYRGYIDLNYSITHHQFEGIGNLQVDPLFEDTLYHLASNSPAIDAGAPETIFNDYEDTMNPGFALWPAQGTVRNDMGSFGATDSASLQPTSYQMIEEFLYETFDGLPYRIAYPYDYDSTQNYPLTIILHGSGMGGTNNFTHVWLGMYWRCNAQHYGYNDFTVVPQSPSGEWPAATQNILYNLIQNLLNSLPIDSTRIVSTGWSAGGWGTCNLLQNYPHLFAAGIPISGVTPGSNLKNIPLWLFHGAADENVGVGTSRSMISELENIGLSAIRTEEISEIELDNAITGGAQLLYSEYEGANHFITRYTYDNYYLYKWLKLQRRNSIFPAITWIYPRAYLQSGDSLIIRSTFLNPDNYNANYKAVIENFDNDTIRIIQLFDDGLHYDSLAQDGTFGNISAPLFSGEESYRIGVEIHNLDLEETSYFRDLSRFTTTGPVVVEDYVITSNDTLPNPGDQIRFKLELHNNGLTTTAVDIMAVISTTDSCISAISKNSANYGDIPAGESVIPTSGFQQYTVIINPNSPVDKDVLFNVDIYSEGNYFWSDSFAFYIDSSVTAIPYEKNSLPDKYALHQNYPNPFNPSTTINYQIPELSLVTIKIYDVLGSEVVTLVNEEKPAGYYDIEFDASILSSGIYIYQLKTGMFIQTKKMVLLK
ncbi:MAG: T9SS type A sorting domain-containing protein, partial [Candidatus Kariarchaeaceae archaeon]